MPYAIPYILVDEPYMDAEAYGNLALEGARKNLAANEWKGAWAPGAYKLGNVVRDGSYTCVALADTSDRAAPVPDGNPAWGLPDAPTWTAGTATGTSYSGMELDFNGNPREVNGFRFWIPDASTDMNYVALLQDITDAANPVLLSTQDLPGAAIGWEDANIPHRIFMQGQKIRVSLIASKASSSSSWGPFVWQYDGTGCGPDENKYQRNGAHTQICVHENDKNDVNRSTNLDQLKEGDHLTLTETDNSARWDRYRIVENNKLVDVYVLDVIREANGSDVRSGKDVNFTADIYAGVQPSPYVRLPDYFVGNPPQPDIVVRGFASDDWPPTAFNNDAHGVDLRGVQLIQSADWDIWSISRL